MRSVRQNRVVGAFAAFVAAGWTLCAAAASAQHYGAAGAYRHDSFYLRMSLGVNAATLNRSVEADASGVLGYEGDSEISGGALSSELSIGGTVARGLVLAGSLYWGGVFDATIERDDGSEGELEGSLHFSMIGITLDYYIDETGGFHLGGTLGPALAWARLPDGSRFDFIGGRGGGIAFNIGYDWWVGQEWSLGILGRILGAALTGEDSEGGITASEDDGYGSLSLLFTAVYH